MLKEELLENNLIRHYAENDEGQKFKIRQIETGIIYDEAIDILPCRYTYEATDIEIIEPDNEELVD